MTTRTGQDVCARRIALALGVWIALYIPGAVSAAPIIDGRYDPAEGYTNGWSLDFSVEKSDNIVSGGQLWVHEDASTGDVSVAFVQPLTLVDNTYGDNTVGWGKGVAPSGKNHNFEDLLESDKARFVFTDADGNTVLDITLDYIAETSAGSGVYRSPGVAGSDGAVDTGSADDVKEWGSSLDYNFNTLGFVLTENSPETDALYTENPSYPGWEFAVAYELRVDADVFAAVGFGEVAVPIVHNSPNKIGKNKVWPDPGDPLPEPGAVSILALGGLTLLARRRRRRTTC